MDLDWKIQQGEIKKWDKQFPVDIETPDGEFILRHKVDFRIHHFDGSFELLETKGFEQRDYRIIKRLIEVLWLPAHLDHTYTVLK